MDRDALQQPPRNVKDTILSRALILKTLLSAAVIISGTLFIFWKEVRPVLMDSLSHYWLSRRWGRLGPWVWTVPARPWGSASDGRCAYAYRGPSWREGRGSGPHFEGCWAGGGTGGRPGMDQK